MSTATTNKDVEAIADPVERALARECAILEAKIAKIAAVQNDNPHEDGLILSIKIRQFVESSKGQPEESIRQGLLDFKRQAQDIDRRIKRKQKFGAMAMLDQELELSLQLDRLRDASQRYAWRKSL